MDVRGHIEMHHPNSQFGHILDILFGRVSEEKIRDGARVVL
jgi:hypothetical protein